MPKRFIDTDIWFKNWYMDLTPINKLFWNYLFTRCSSAGIWDINFKLAEMLIGEKLDIEDIKKIFKSRYTEIDNGRKWFIQEFISFQYGELNENCNPHKPVIASLKKFTLYVPLNKGLTSLMDKDKDKDKEQDKDKDKDKDKKKRFIKPTIEEVKNYILEKKYEINADKWYNHYESNGWKVGKNKMVNWKAAIRNWIPEKKKSKIDSIKLDPSYGTKKEK